MRFLKAFCAFFGGRNSCRMFQYPLAVQRYVTNAFRDSEGHWVFGAYLQTWNLMAIVSPPASSGEFSGGTL